MALKPWYTVVTPREDLRSGKPLDASEFAVHLDQVRDGRAPKDYQDPKRFFQRTFLTQNLTKFAAEVVRRLSGETTETSAVFNLTTQFGGGKTHSLTLLYHLAQNGPAANEWAGVAKLLKEANIRSIPKCATAVFVGTEFDPLTGRGGSDGTPLRKTPWGEVAFQLGGNEGFEAVREHEETKTAPAGDVIRKFLPKDKPCLILMDELMNYVSRARNVKLHTQLYNFIHNLSEEARGQKNVVLVASLPASELEMTTEDQTEYNQLKKLIDRLSKAVIMSADSETSEIIRRRLFEWDEKAISENGRPILPKEAAETVTEYANWITSNRQQLPPLFPLDKAKEVFQSTYPFHPTVLSVFERKWQTLPRFQQTRGILRLLALWVSQAYKDGYAGAHKDPLIGMGTAPMDNPMFRAAMFEQMGETRLEAAVTTDISGKADSHSLMLDKEADEVIKKTRLHKKASTAIFFESCGGQARDYATVPEIRLDVGEPGLDIGNVETVLETLYGSCYHLTAAQNRYRFSMAPNLNKLLADRRAAVEAPRIEESVRAEIQKVFNSRPGVERAFFPDRSNSILDRALLTFVVMSPDTASQDQDRTKRQLEGFIKECGNSARSYKSALIFCVPESAAQMREEARKLLAWDMIQHEQADLRLDDSQKAKLEESIKGAKRDLKESVWKAYKLLYLLDKDGSIKQIDLGLLHSSSSSEGLTGYLVSQLKQIDCISDTIGINFLSRNWSPAFREWPTKSVRDAFFSSPQFPRLLNADALKDTISRAVREGVLAYVGKGANGSYTPFYFKKELNSQDIEFSDEMFLVQGSVAEEYLSKPQSTPGVPTPSSTPSPSKGPAGWPTPGGPMPGTPIPTPEAPSGAPEDTYLQGTWSGEVSPQKWMNFYMKVLSKFAAVQDLKLQIDVSFDVEGRIPASKVDEVRMALRELGLPGEFQTKK